MYDNHDDSYTSYVSEVVYIRVKLYRLLLCSLLYIELCICMFKFFCVTQAMCSHNNVRSKHVAIGNLKPALRLSIENMITFQSNLSNHSYIQYVYLLHLLIILL